MTSPNFPFLPELDLTGVVESMVDGRLSLVDRAIEAIDNAVGGEIANEQVVGVNPDVQSDTTETESRPEKNVVKGDAFVTSGKYVYLKGNSYEDQQKGIEVARDKVVLAFKLKEKEAAEEPKLRKAA